MKYILVIAIILCVLLAIGLFIVVRDTLRGKGKWRPNLKTVSCPKCGKKAPRVRKPTSLRQAFWGGCICKEHGCESDKWGIEIIST